jgi:hypothetical protein
MEHAPMKIRFAVLGLVGVASLVACMEGGLLDIREDPTDLFWSLDLNENAINLSLDDSQPEYHTFQLVATPRTVDGQLFPIPDGERVLFESSDTNRVTVTADGLIRAKAVTPANAQVRIVARLTTGRGPVSNADTAWVAVTQDVRPIASFSIQPLRTTYGIGYDTIMAARALSPDDSPVTGIRVSYSSSVPKVAAYDATGLFRPLNLGTVMLRASTMAYGASYRDSVQLTVTDPEVFVVVNNGATVDGQTTLYFDPEVLTIKAGQGVAFAAGNFGCMYGIQFEDSSGIGASPVNGATGDVPFFCGVGARQIRMFPEPGTYRYSGGAQFNFPTAGEPVIIVVPADS